MEASKLKFQSYCQHSSCRSLYIILCYVINMNNFILSHTSRTITVDKFPTVNHWFAVFPKATVTMDLSNQATPILHTISLLESIDILVFLPKFISFEKIHTAIIIVVILMAACTCLLACLGEMKICFGIVFYVWISLLMPLLHLSPSEVLQK